VSVIPVVEFLIGFIVGALFTILCIGIWVINDEQKDKREENDNDKT
jgi:hypothetical protein